MSILLDFVSANLGYLKGFGVSFQILFGGLSEIVGCFKICLFAIYIKFCRVVIGFLHCFEVISDISETSLSSICMNILKL